MVRYKLGQVGITRHPEIYAKEEEHVFDTVKEELALWKVAEKIHKTTSKLNKYELSFIFHYVMCLRGMNDYEMIQLHEFAQTKIIESRAKQMALNILGKSAKQLVEKPSGVKTRKMWWPD